MFFFNLENSDPIFFNRFTVGVVKLYHVSISAFFVVVLGMNQFGWYPVYIFASLKMLTQQESFASLCAINLWLCSIRPGGWLNTYVNQWVAWFSFWLPCAMFKKLKILNLSDCSKISLLIGFLHNQYLYYCNFFYIRICH